MPHLIGPVVAQGRMRDREQPELRAHGLTLRPWSADDAPMLVRAYRHPDIQHWHMHAFESEREAAQWALGWREHWQAESRADWAVTDADSGEVIGRAGVWGINFTLGHGEVVYWVVPQARGAGVASRATARVAQWALEDLGLKRLELLHSVANEPSCRVAAKTGFALEGTLREVLLHADGWHDMHLHARVREDDLSAR